jgi:hypothetical protein
MFRHLSQRNRQGCAPISFWYISSGIGCRDPAFGILAEPDND